MEVLTLRRVIRDSQRWAFLLLCYVLRRFILMTMCGPAGCRRHCGMWRRMHPCGDAWMEPTNRATFRPRAWIEKYNEDDDELKISKRCASESTGSVDVVRNGR